MSTITQREKKKYVQAKGKVVMLRAAIRQVREQLFGLATMMDAQRHIINAFERKLLIILLLFVLGYLSGCCTLKGACEDTSWLLRTTADNIQPAE